MTVEPDQPLLFDPQQLLKLASHRMPFGKYANRLLIDLPEPYVVWFANEGIPKVGLKLTDWNTCSIRSENNASKVA